MPAQSKPAGVAPQERLEPSTAEYLFELKRKWDESRILSSIGHVYSIIHTKSLALKVAYFNCILVNHGWTLSFTSIVNLLSQECVLDAFKWMLSKYEQISQKKSSTIEQDSTEFDIPDLPPGMEPHGFLSAAFDGEKCTITKMEEENKESWWSSIKFDPKLGFDQKEPIPKQLFSFLKKNMSFMRPIIGILAVIACISGFDKVLEMRWLANISLAVVKLAASIKGAHVIWDDVNKGVDSILRLVYSAFGEVYYSKEEEQFKFFTDKINSLRERTQNLVDKSQYDVFGFLKDETIEDLSHTLDELNREQVSLSNRDKTLVGMNAVLMQINANLQALRDRRAALISSGQKQNPVKAWFFSPPGHGKSYIAGRLAKQLSGSRPVYTKSPMDEYASGYRGNPAWLSDDIFQNASPDSPDIKDWFLGSTTAPYSLNQAAIQQKGMPMTSRYMIATSNFAYAPNNCGIRSNEAFDRRRDFLVYVHMEGRDEYIGQHGCNPPESFYATARQRLFLFTPLPEQGSADYKYKGVPNATTPGYIGEITYDELVTMISELEKKRAEDFRQYLLSTFAPNNPHITIPEVPFEYDANLFETSLIFDMKTKEKRYTVSRAGVDQYRQKLRLEKQAKEARNLSQESDDSLAEEMSCFAPVTIMRETRCKAVVFSGQPGIGKSFQVNRFFATENTPFIRVDNNFLRQHDWFGKIINSGSHIYFDDFSTTDQLTDAFVQAIEAYDRGDLGVPSLIATCNWGRVKEQHTRDMIERRCEFVNLAVSSTVEIKRRIKKMNLEDFLAATCGDDQVARNAAITLSGSKAFSQYIDIPESLRRHFAANVVVHETQIVNQFEVPYPSDVNYKVYIDLANLDGDAIAYYRKATEAVVTERVEGKDRAVSSKTKIFVLTKALPIFQSAAFRSSPENWTAVFNQEKHEAVIRGTIVVHVTLDEATSPTGQGLVMVGFTDIDGIMIAFNINHEESSPQIIDGVFHHNGQRVNFPQGNEKYERVCRKLWTPSVSMDTISVSSEEYALSLMRTSSIFQVFNMAVTTLCLIGDGLTIATFAHGAMSEIWNKFSTVLPDTVEQESARPTHANDDSGSSDSTHGKNADEKKDGKKNIHLESTRPAHSSNDSGPSESAHGKNTDDKKDDKKQVVLESARPSHANDQSGPLDSSDGKKAETKINPRALELDERPTREPDEHDLPKFINQGWETKGTPWYEYESAYDHTTKRFTKDPICLESDGFTSGAIVWNPHTKYFGVVWNEYILYAHEYRHAQWTILSVPRSDKWQLVSLKDLPKALFKQWAKTNLSADTSTITATIGKSFDATACSEVDMSSIFAFTMGGGIPYDAYLERPRPDCLTYIFNPTFGNMLPAHARKYLEKNNRKILAQFDFNVHQEGSQDPVMVEQSVLAIQHSVQIFSGGKHCVFGLKIAKRLILSVAHAARYAPLTTKIDGREYPLTLVASNKRDMAIYEILDKTCPQFKDITHIFVDENELMSYLGNITTAIPTCLVTPAGNNVPVAMTTYCQADALTKETQEVAFRGKTLSYRATVGNFFSTGVSKHGDCGATLFMANKSLSGKLIGMHRAGSNGCSLCAIVTRQWIREIIAQPSAIQNTGDEIRPEAMADPHALMKHDEVISLWESSRVDQETNLLQVGLLQKAIFNPTSTRIRRTGILFDTRTAYEPSIMSETDPRAQGFKPMIEGLRRYGHSYLEEEIDEMEVFDAADEIGNHCATEIMKRGKDVRIFSNTEVLNTAPILEYCNAKPLDRSGSPGFPHIMHNAGMRKGDYMFQNKKNGRWYIKPQHMYILDNVNEILKDAAQGIEHIHPLVAYCKDEPLKLKKIYEVKKTRLFFSCPFEYLICFRRYFNSAMYRVQELYQILPPKIGINGQNFADWHHMTSRLEQMSPVGFASDVESFDASVPKIFIQACTRIWNQIYTRCSQPDEDVTKGNLIRTTLHKAIEGAYVVSRKRLFKLSQAQVSGNPATAIENSFIIWMLYYLVWKRLAEKHDAPLATYKEFRKHVELICYGDDNLCTVSLHTPWFNFNSFAREAKRFGFKITDAQKRGGDVPDFQRLAEMDFLKRGFHKINGLAVGPLDKSSIEKSCEWIRGKKYEVTEDVLEDWPISNERQLIAQSIDSQWPEMALHGSAYYQQMRDKLLKQAGQIGISLNPPSWEAALLECGYAL